MQDKNLVWEQTGNRKVFECAIFSILQSEQVASDGYSGQFYLLDAKDWVVVIPVLETGSNNKDLILVRQYRFGLGDLCLEFPGGIVDPGEDPLRAAQRELQEETGYRAASWQHLGTINPNPSFMTNRMHSYVARQLELAGPQELDEAERIDIHQVGLDDLVNGHEPEFWRNGVMVIAWHWFLQWVNKGK